MAQEETLVQGEALGLLDIEWQRHRDISWGRWGAAGTLRLGGRQRVRGLWSLKGRLVPRCSQMAPLLCWVALRVSPCEVREEG